MNEENVRCAEVILSKYFTEHGEEKWLEVKDIMIYIKSIGMGIRRAETKEARKRLKIQSEVFEGEYYWKWENEARPDEMWALKSREVFRC